MAPTPLLLLLLLGAGSCAQITTETIATTETTAETTGETTATETTGETTGETTATPRPATPNITVPKTTSDNGTRPSVVPRTVPTATNATSPPPAGNATTNGTAAPVPSTAAITLPNATTDGSHWVTAIVPNATTVVPNATNAISVVPSFPAGAGTRIPGSTTVFPVRNTTTAAPRRTPMAVPGGDGGGGGGPVPSTPPAQLLVRVPLSFHILNRGFNETLRDPASGGYRSLSREVLDMFEDVFGRNTGTYVGCTDLQFSPGSVAVQSVLVFGPGNVTVTGDTIAQQLRNSLDRNGFVRGLQLAQIQSTEVAAVTFSESPVPGWAIALLVLVSILLLLSILSCLLMTTCTCRRSHRGKLDLGTKDTFHPMAEYPPYQSHGRYAPPSSKPNPYSQVAGSNGGGGTGTFTYTNPSPTADSL